MKRLLIVTTVAVVALFSAGFASRSTTLAHTPAPAHAPMSSPALAPSPYRVAFDLTSRDTLDQKAVLRWVNEVVSNDPAAQVEVVMYGKGFELVMPERSPFAEKVRDALQNPRVTFAVCAIALKSNQVQTSQLVPGVQVVPDGLHELVMKQQDDWGYIKVGH